MFSNINVNSPDNSELVSGTLRTVIHQIVNPADGLPKRVRHDFEFKSSLLS